MCSRQSSARAERTRRLPSAFTLIEVMLAVAITGLVAFGIFRFVGANLQAVEFSSEQSVREASMRTLMSFFQDQLNDLPGTLPGALLGEAHVFNNLPSDEIQWLSGAGPGLFTIHALGDYKVTLSLRQTKDPAVLELGVRRLVANGSSKDDNWLTLMKDVKAMEIRYFDVRLNAWLEKWTDQAARPSLVRLRIWRTDDAQPYEQIFSLPPTTRNPGS